MPSLWRSWWSGLWTILPSWEKLDLISSVSKLDLTPKWWRSTLLRMSLTSPWKERLRPGWTAQCPHLVSTTTARLFRSDTGLWRVGEFKAVKPLQLLNTWTGNNISLTHQRNMYYKYKTWQVNLLYVLPIYNNLSLIYVCIHFRTTTLTKITWHKNPKPQLWRMFGPGFHDRGGKTMSEWVRAFCLFLNFNHTFSIFNLILPQGCTYFVPIWSSDLYLF